MKIYCIVSLFDRCIYRFTFELYKKQIQINS